MLLKGSCHCGNIRFELDWQPEPAEIPAHACTCSFCRSRRRCQREDCRMSSSAASTSSISTRTPRILTWKSLRPSNSTLPSRDQRPRSPVRYMRAARPDPDDASMTEAVGETPSAEEPA